MGQSLKQHWSLHLDCFDFQVGPGVVGTFACYQGSGILTKLSGRQAALRQPESLCVHHCA